VGLRGGEEHLERERATKSNNACSHPPCRAPLDVPAAETSSGRWPLGQLLASGSQPAGGLSLARVADGPAADASSSSRVRRLQPFTLREPRQCGHVVGSGEGFGRATPPAQASGWRSQGFLPRNPEATRSVAGFPAAPRVGPPCHATTPPRRGADPQSRVRRCASWRSRTRSLRPDGRRRRVVRVPPARASS